MIPELLNSGQHRSLPVQMDMISKNTITICTSQKRTLGCREGGNIAITDVFWGRLSDQICPSDDGDPVTDCDGSVDALGVVKEVCEGKKECELAAKHQKLQKKGSIHCPGVNKYLVTKYTCMPESKGILLCESAESEISCEAGWIIQLADVFWGRRSSGKTCGLGGGLECDASDYASMFLKKKCNGQHKCLVQNDADILDSKKKSSCNEASKYLLLNYICSPPKDSAQKNTIPPNDEESSSFKEESSKELMGFLENQGQSKPAVSSFTKINKEKPTASVSSVSSHSIASPIVTADKSKKASPQVKSENETIAEENKILEKKSATLSQVKENTIDDTSIDTSSVRSILSRAKNILKTLDLDSASVRRKRFRIARPEKSATAKKNQRKGTKKSKIGRVNKKSKVIQSYPDNFILKSWYGY